MIRATLATLLGLATPVAGCPPGQIEVVKIVKDGSGGSKTIRTCVTILVGPGSCAGGAAACADLRKRYQGGSCGAGAACAAKDKDRSTYPGPAERLEQRIETLRGSGSIGAATGQSAGAAMKALGAADMRQEVKRGSTAQK